MADSKVSDLTAATPVVSDEIYLVDDPGGRPASKKAALSTLDTLFKSTTQTLTNKSIDGDNNTITNLATGAEVTVAANSIDSAAYVDGSIDEEHLADNAVSLAKMAHGTDGNLITYDAAGAPAAVTTGTANQVLTSNGAGAAPTFQSHDISCQVRKTGAQTISNASVTTITWDTEDYDTDTMHDNSTNNNRITIPTGGDGKYLFIANLNFVGNATGIRYIGVRVNGSSKAIVRTNAVGTFPAVVWVAGVVELVATDYVDVSGYQNSGGNLDVNTDSYFLVQKVDVGG